MILALETPCESCLKNSQIRVNLPFFVETSEEMIEVQVYACSLCGSMRLRRKVPE